MIVASTGIPVCHVRDNIFIIVIIITIINIIIIIFIIKTIFIIIRNIIIINNNIYYEMNFSLETKGRAFSLRSL